MCEMCKFFKAYKFTYFEHLGLLHTSKIYKQRSHAFAIQILLSNNQIYSLLIHIIFIFHSKHAKNSIYQKYSLNVYVLLFNACYSSFKKIAHWLALNSTNIDLRLNAAVNFLLS